ncbi:nucleosomal histone kinase 1-like [Scaptodrosophila lebanonensis]|uniref:non-specific serine/threonine protein kinase n=1 Tax=Drosophila lebanonensis TaxID=7225 RepID=A0A6J2TX87_DROLE|nr:nucleosomal histone kinase 1-like [Scaptodrosophila lebanonensis]
MTNDWTNLKYRSVLTDDDGDEWTVGFPIGKGGFGHIYATRRLGKRIFDAVVKCEPHTNTTLSTEIDFYAENAKIEDIERYEEEHGIETLGMSYMLGHGSKVINNQKIRFLVMPLLGTDLNIMCRSIDTWIPRGTVYRIAVQILHVCEYIHGRGYIHGDLKEANIIVGTADAGQAYLVDFGLSTKLVTGAYVERFEYMHRGTEPYTSRDAHRGVSTKRSDLEMLGLCLMHLLGAHFPWEASQLRPNEIRDCKVQTMSDMSKGLKTFFPNGAPLPIAKFMEYVNGLTHLQTPDYEKCRKMFLTELKRLKIPNTGALKFPSPKKRGRKRKREDDTN